MGETSPNLEPATGPQAAWAVPANAVQKAIIATNVPSCLFIEVSFQIE
jgi:hypothetical protein